MKPYLIEIFKEVFLKLSKIEWLFITLAAVLINACLSPNFIINANIIRHWLRWGLLSIADKQSL